MPAAIATQPAADPNQFMQQAADAMSLTAPDMKPWHLRAKYKSFDEHGPVREGVFEEWWSDANHFKASYTQGDATYVEYRDRDKTVLTGDPNVLTSPERNASSVLLHPLPSPAILKALDFTQQERKAGAVSLRCFEGTNHYQAKPSAYCFDESATILRLTQDIYGAQTTWNGIVSLHGHPVGSKMKVSTPALDPWITVDIEQTDSSLTVDEAALVPPADAKPLRRKVAISAAVMQGNRLSSAPPHYPADALQARVQGTVVLQATISAEGAVVNLRVISGPALLQQAAMDAAKMWRYRPYKLNGEPVEVETTMNVVFNLR